MKNKAKIPFVRVSAFVHDRFPGMHEQRVLSLANATTGVLHSASLAISAIGAGLAGIRGRVPKHATKQVDRLLSNPKLDLDSLATQWVPFLLSDRSEAVLALDWTDFDADNHATLSLNLITRHGRATMLLWKTINKSDLAGNRNHIEDQLLAKLADIIQHHVPHSIRITIVCDRGFADHKFYQWITELGFDFVIRFKQGSLVQDSIGDSRKAADWVPTNGRAKKIEPAFVTAQRFPVAAVVCVKEKGMKDSWCLATSLDARPARQIINLYSRRFTIEETFRDGKDPHFGLGLSQVRIRDPHRRDRLLFVGALAMALLTLLGAASEAAGLDRLLKVNTSKQRTHSLFRQGLYWFNALPNMPEKWLHPLMEHFNRILQQHSLCQSVFGVL
jgi:Transposase DDE domain